MNSQLIAKPLVFVPQGPYPLLRYEATHVPTNTTSIKVLSEAQMRREEVRTLKPFTRDGALDLMDHWNECQNQKVPSWRYRLVD